MLVSIAVLAAFVSGAVVFSQVRLVPDMFEERTDDLDVVTRAESRGDNLAYNFLPLASWYSVSQATWDVGTSRRVYTGCDDGGVSCVDHVETDLVNTAESETENTYYPNYAGNLTYQKCKASFSELDLEFDFSSDRAYIEPDGRGHMVEVICSTTPYVKSVFKSNGAPYDVYMGANRYLEMAKIVAGGVIEAERVSEELEGDGDWDDGENDGYYELSISGSDSCEDQTASSAKSDAESDAESTAINHAQRMPDAILKGGRDRVGEPGFPGHGPRGARYGMEEEIGGSQICAFGICSPPMPAHIDWTGLEPSIDTLENDYTVTTKSRSASSCCVRQKWVPTSCGPYESPPCGYWTCAEYGHTGSAEVKWKLNKIRGELKVLDSRYEIPTNSGWRNLTTKVEYERSFPTPPGW